MTAEEIRDEDMNYAGWLREIAAQLAELVKAVEELTSRL